MPFYHSPFLPFYHQFPRVRTCVVYRCRPPLRQSSQTGHTATLPHCPSPSPTRRVQTANRSVCSLYILYPANRLVYASRPAGTPGHFNKVKTFDSSIYFFFLQTKPCKQAATVKMLHRLRPYANNFPNAEKPTIHTSMSITLFGKGRTLLSQG